MSLYSLNVLSSSNGKKPQRRAYNSTPMLHRSTFEETKRKINQTIPQCSLSEEYALKKQLLPHFHDKESQI